MMYKPGEKCYSIDNGVAVEHIITAINFHPLCQMLKIDGKWQCADVFFKSKEDIADAVISGRLVR